MKNLIIHHHCVIAAYELAQQDWFDASRRKQYELAFHTIEKLLKEDPNTSKVKYFDPVTDPVLNQFKSGDTVILYGTMRSGCVHMVAQKLLENGVYVAYSIDGTFD